MGTSQRLRNDLIDDFETQQIGSRDFQGLGGFRRLRTILPNNGSATLRTDHRIVGVFQHQRPVRYPDAQSAPRTSLSDDQSDNGDLQHHHFPKIHRNGFGDMPFLGADARVGSGRIDNRNHRQFEFCGQFHQPQGLAVTVRMRRTEISLDLFLRIPALLGPDYHDSFGPQVGESPDHRLIVGKQPITV